MTLSKNKILTQDLQESLQGADFVLFNTIWNLSDQVEAGMDRVTIPRYSSSNVGDVVTGTEPALGDASYADDQLILDQHKRSWDWINKTQDMQTMTSRKMGFIESAPKLLAESIEDAIATAFTGASVHDFNSGTANSFDIDDISEAKAKLDKARIPKIGRYLSVNADGMKILASMQEFEDGSKGLSDEALRAGVVSKVKGFFVVQCESVASDKVHCYHEKAAAFAFQDEAVAYSEKDFPEKNQIYVQAMTHHGVKLVNSGKLKSTITMAV